MAAKFFTGLPMDGPDPECVQGYGEAALVADRTVPAASQDHSYGTPRRNSPVLLQLRTRPPVAGCAESPLAGFDPIADSSADNDGCGCGSQNGTCCA
jgi:hypothetical protein